MSEWFVHPWGLVLLATVPGCFWLHRVAEEKRAGALQRFGTPASARRNRHGWLLIVGAVALLSVAIAQPVGKARGGAENRAPDVVFLLDVSRSMGTRDGAASRLELARSSIRGVVESATDQRFGLVIFAGNAGLECPLTNDYVFFRSQLWAASRGAVTVGGTRLADAIRFAAEKAFDDASRNARELVLISDGGDESSSPANAAQELKKRGIRLVVAGVGDRSTHAFVPESEVDATPILYQGRPVTAPLDEEALQEICKASSSCAYTSLPSAEFEHAVRDTKSLIVRDGADGGSIIRTAFSLGAAILLAGESLFRRFAR